MRTKNQNLKGFGKKKLTVCFESGRAELIMCVFPSTAVQVLFTRIRAILNLKLTPTQKYQAYSHDSLHYSEYMVFNLHIQHTMNQLVNKKYTVKMRGFS